MSVTSIQYYRLFYSLFSPPLYPVPGCGELEVLPSIHADLYSDIMAVWICCCYFLVTDQLYTRNTCYVVRLCGRGSWGTSFTQLTGSFSLLCRAVAAFLYDVWLVGLFFLLMAQAWILCIHAFLNVSLFCGYRNVLLVVKFVGNYILSLIVTFGFAIIHLMLLGMFDVIWWNNLFLVHLVVHYGIRYLSDVCIYCQTRMLWYSVLNLVNNVIILIS